MKRTRIGLLLLFALVVAVGITLAVKSVLAQGKIEVKTVEGHSSPLLAKITYPDNTTRNVLVLGIGGDNGEYRTHQYNGLGEADAKVTLWLDTVARIEDTSDVNALFILKDGRKRRLKYNPEGYQSPNNIIRHLYISNPDGEAEHVALEKLQSIEFTKPVKKDKEGNAMFDQWKYSPFTGEKLSKD